MQSRLQESIKAAIDNSQQEFRSIHLEIRPQFLVPDTNCFVDDLHGIEALLAVKRFTIVVPLIGMFTAIFLPIFVIIMKFNGKNENLEQLTLVALQ